MSAPSAPVITVLPVASPNTLQFYWEPPAVNGGFPLSSYTLLCSSIPFSTVFGPSVNYAVVSSLTNAQDYTFQINASNQIGYSPYRPFTIVQPGSVPGGVTNIGISTLNLSTANIVWNFSTNTGEAQTKWFVITATPSTNTLSTIVQSAHGVERSRAIRNLSSYTYTFLVQAVNDAGYAFPLAQAKSTFTFGQYINANGNFFPAAQISSLMLWFDASDAGTITLNAGNVSNITDKSGNNYNLIQGTTAYQPAYSAALLNSLAGLTFNAAANTQVGFTPSGSFTVAATDNGLYYSLDGINNWTACINASSGSTQCNTPVYNGSMWVCAIGSYPHYSYDGITWSRSNQGYIAGGQNSAVISVGWGNSMWLMGLVPGSQAIIYSYDGITWQNSQQGTALVNGYAVMCVCWNGSLWTAGLRYHPTSQTMYSYDGINWQFSPSVNTFSNNYVNAIAWNGRMFVAGGAGSGYSYDGINWQPHTSSVFTNSVAWNGKIWVLCGSNVYYSYDGINIITATGATTLMSSFRTVAWSGAAWLIGGTKTAGGVSMISSTDGITWANVTSASSNISITTGLSIVGLASAASQPLPYKNVQPNSTIGVTVLSVVQPTWAPGSGQTNNFFFEMGTPTTQYGLSLTNTYTTGGEAVIGSTTSYHTNPSTLAAFTQNTPVLISQSNNNINDYLYINGNPNPDVVTASPMAFNNTFSQLAIGGNGSNGSCFTGNIYETIVVAGVLQTQRRQQLEGYLAWKWALHTLLPSSHPYKLAAPTYSPATFDPTLISGLTVWLDGNDTTGTGATVANGTAVTTWYDKSGWGRNATLTGSPTIISNAGNSKAGVNFSSTLGNAMYGAITMPAQTYINELNMFIVYKNVGAAPTYQDLISRGLTASNIQSNGNTFSLYNGNFTVANALGVTYPSPYNTNMNIWNGLVSQQSATTSYFKLNINGVEQTVVSGSPAFNFTPYDSAGFVTFGSSRGGGCVFTGYFCEMLIYNTPMTTLQREQIEGYLAWKWGLQSSLQTSHPYYVATPTPNPVAFNPSQINGCAFWLDATDPLATGSAPNTGTAVNTWYDKSGNNRNFNFNGSAGTYTAGLFGSLPGIDLTNGSGYTCTAFPNTINATIAMAINFQPGFFSTNWASLFHHGTHNDDFSLEKDSAAGTTTNAIHLQTNNINTTNDIAVYPSVTMIIYGTMARGLTCYLSSYSKATGKQQITYTTTLTWTYGSKIAYLGKSMYNEAINSYLGEVAYYNRQLNASEEANLVNYLQNKWGTNPTFLPTQITNCAAWYDANDPLGNGVQQAGSYALSTWADKSGNNRTLTVGSSSNVNYTMNLFGANPGVQVNANLGLSTAPFQNSANASIFMVVNVNGNIGTDGTFFVHGSKTNDFAVKRNGNTQTLELQTNNDNSSTVPYSTNTTTLLSGVMTNGLSRQFTITTAYGQQTVTASNPLSWTSGVKILTVGSSINTASTESSNSYIGEVVYYTAALSVWQRQVVEGYLAWKWSLAAGLPITHPWRQRAPTYQSFAWSPVGSTPGLGLWLDSADASTLLYQGGNNSLANTSVNFWYDKSPSLNHMYQPTVNYQPQYLLDSTYNKYGLYYNGQLSSNTLWQSLFRYSPTNTPFNQSAYWTIITVHRITSATATASGEIYRYYNDTPMMNYFRYWSDIYAGNAAFNAGYSTAAAASGIGCTLSNGNNFSYYGNGTRATSGAKGTTVMTTTTNINIGNYNTGGPGGEPLQGYIFEFLVFKHALSDTRRQLIEGFLAYKWGIQANLPATHPFYSIQPTDYTIASPSSISGCTLWLDGQDLTTLWQNTAASTQVTAVGQSVNYWTDKSGSNNHMTTSGLSVTAPLFSNLGINFGASTNVSKMISTTTPAKSLNATVFIVVTPVTTTNGAATVFSHQAPTDHDTNVFGVRGNTAATSFSLYNSSASVTTVVGNPTILYGTMTSGTNFAFQSVTTSGGTTTATATRAATITTAAGPIYIGNDESGNWSNAMISEIIYYQNVLTPNQIWNNLEYLENKWGPGATFPNNLINTASTWLPLLTNSHDIGQTKQASTQNGSVTFTTIGGKQCTNFNNSTATYITLPFTGGNQFTICYWLYASDGGYYDPWALSGVSTGSSGGYGINADYTNGTQHFYIGFSGGNINPGGFTMTPGSATWYHLTLTVNRTTGVCQSYYNGIYQNSATGSGTLNNSLFLILGKDATGARAYNGYLRHFMVYNSILTQAQIQNVMLFTGAS